MDRIKAPSHLCEAVLNRLKAEQRKASRIKLGIFSVLALASLAAIFPAVNYLVSEFGKSGSSQYLSLIFSDWSTLASYWQDFALSLAESLPVLGIIAVLSSVFMLLNSIRIAIKNIKPARVRARLA